MSGPLPTTAALAGIYTGNRCFSYDVVVTQSFWDADKLAAGVAFLVGALAGGLLGLLCAKLCMKDIARVKDYNQDQVVRAEKGLKAKHKVTIIEPTKVAPDANADEVGKKRSIKRKRSSLRSRRGTSKAEDTGVPVALLSITSDEELMQGTPSAETKGLADVLLRRHSASIDAELSTQDLESFTALDTELREENMNTMVQMLRVLLQQQMMKGAVGEDQFKDVLTTIQSNMAGIISTTNREKEEQEEDLKKKYVKDPEKLDQELEKLHGNQMSQINSMVGDLAEQLRKDVLKNSKMTEEEVDGLMSQLAEQMAESERKLAEERTRQTMALEDRLARRKLLADMHRIQRDQQDKEITWRRDAHEKTLQNLVDDGKMLERQKQDLLDVYEDDLHRVQKGREEQFEVQQLHLAEKLKRNRDQRLAKMKEQQQKDQDDFIKQSAQSTNAESVREAFHELAVKQRDEKDALLDDLDEIEAEEFTKLLKSEEKEQKGEMQETEERLAESLTSRAQLSSREAEHIMDIHYAEMDEYEKMKKAERKRMQAIMQEKLEQRRLRAEEASLVAKAEEEALTEQQTNMVNKVLSSQVDLDEEAKRRILHEHEQQMARVNNQLQMSKMRQQKALEQRLSQRRARVADLKQQKDKALQEAKNGKEKDKVKLAEQLEKQIQNEEKKLEKMRNEQVNDLRKQLSQETEEALKDQEKQIGLLIARLEVGAARRQAIISKQDQTIKELEEKMTNKVSQHKGDVSTMHVDHLITQHTHQVEALEDKLHESRDRQEQSLQERLQVKRLKKEREMERSLETEAQEEWLMQKKSGAGLATSILSQMMLEQRHKMAMEQLEKEMQTEMQKQRAELNQELEISMQAELEDQKKSFLAQLAAISNMSKNEITEVVENAVADAGGDEKSARKLAKELRIEMKRAKTDMESEAQDYSSMRRTQTDYDDDYRQERPRPKSSRQAARSSFRERDERY